MSSNNFTTEQVKKRILLAYQMLLIRDSYLIEVRAHERSLTHKLAEYLQILFPEHDVDCEYNRNLVESKLTLPWQEKLTKLVDEINNEDTPEKRRVKLKNFIEKGVSIYPDIIIHNRGTSNNIAVIEAKYSDDDGINQDTEKLATYKNEPLLYRMAFLVIFPTRNELQKLTEDGIENELIREICL